MLLSLIEIVIFLPLICPASNWFKSIKSSWTVSPVTVGTVSHLMVVPLSPWRAGEVTGGGRAVELRALSTGRAVVVVLLVVVVGLTVVLLDLTGADAPRATSSTSLGLSVARGGCRPK